MKVLDMFSGIGGFSLGLERAGMHTIRFIEQNKFCQSVLAKHWPGVPCDDDVCAADFTDGEADVIVGGFPCQDVSRAGKRAGLSGARSGLYRELVRAIRLVRPRHAILENVAALLGDGMGDVLGDISESGFDAEWDIIPACAIGAPHERERVWIVAHAQGVGCGTRRKGRPPDSFSRVRDETRRHPSNANSAGLSHRDAETSRQAFSKPSGCAGTESWQAWPDEPALCGVDDGIPDLVDRTHALGNSLLPQIPELIGRVIMEAAP